jgi:hypothetical protein
MAVSGGQRNASASACEGVLKPRVCRGRSLSSGSRTHHGSTSSGLLMLTGSPFRILQAAEHGGGRGYRIGRPPVTAIRAPEM